MSREADLVLDAKATLGEGAIWHARRQVLYWVDIEGRTVHTYDPKTGKDRAIDVGQAVGTVVPRRSSGLMLALHHGFAHLNLRTKKLTFVSDPEAGLPNRFNDGKCDPSGRFWAGTMPYEKGADPRGGALWCLHADGRVEKKVKGIGCSNGIAWGLDKKTMYYIDTVTKEIWAYDYDDRTGAISRRRTIVTVPDNEGVPDGMTIDAEEMLWVAHWGGWQVIRWDPRTGKKLRSIRLPAEKITSCAFGGRDLGDLYVTSARVALDEQALKKQPHAGGLFLVRPGVKGVEAFEFAA